MTAKPDRQVSIGAAGLGTVLPRAFLSVVLRRPSVDAAVTRGGSADVATRGTTRPEKNARCLSARSVACQRVA